MFLTCFASVLLQVTHDWETGARERRRPWWPLSEFCPAPAQARSHPGARNGLHFSSAGAPASTKPQPGSTRPYCPNLRPAPCVQPLLVAVYLDERSRAEVLQRCAFQLRSLRGRTPLGNVQADIPSFPVLEPATWVPGACSPLPVIGGPSLPQASCALPVPGRFEGRCHLWLLTLHAELQRPPQGSAALCEGVRGPCHVGVQAQRGRRSPSLGAAPGCRHGAGGRGRGGWRRRAGAACMPKPQQACTLPFCRSWQHA